MFYDSASDSTGRSIKAAASSFTLVIKTLLISITVVSISAMFPLSSSAAETRVADYNPPADIDLPPADEQTMPSSGGVSVPNTETMPTSGSGIEIEDGYTPAVPEESLEIEAIIPTDAPVLEDMDTP